MVATSNPLKPDQTHVNLRPGRGNPGGAIINGPIIKPFTVLLQTPDPAAVLKKVAQQVEAIGNNAVTWRRQRLL